MSTSNEPLAYGLYNLLSDIAQSCCSKAPSSPRKKIARGRVSTERVARKVHRSTVAEFRGSAPQTFAYTIIKATLNNPRVARKTASGDQSVFAFLSHCVFTPHRHLYSIKYMYIFMQVRNVDKVWITHKKPYFSNARRGLFVWAFSPPLRGEGLGVGGTGGMPPLPMGLLKRRTRIGVCCGNPQHRPLYRKWGDARGWHRPPCNAGSRCAYSHTCTTSTPVRRPLGSGGLPPRGNEEEENTK